MNTEKRKTNNRVSFKRKIIKWIRNLFAAGLALVILLPITGVIYEKSAEYLDSRKYAPPGQLINVKGHDMHVFAEGKGDATVVFASGWGIPCPFAEYYPLYNEISKQARIVVYDRPGYGWSKPAKTPRDIDTITKEIHELLVKSGEKPPYILVGHSLGSLEVLRFAQLYRDEVKGIVMIDAGNPEYYLKETINDSALSSLKLKSVLNGMGVFRLLFNNVPKFLSGVYAPRNNFSLVPPELKELDKSMYLKNMVNRNKKDETTNISANALKVLDGGRINNILMTILTSEIEARDPKWKKSQEEFKSWSDESKQLILKGTNHNMHQYVPDIINKEILEILKGVKD